jgi:putative transposase
LVEFLEIRKGRHVVYLLHARLVFFTKRRGKVFGAAHLKRLEEIFRSVCTDFEVI